MEHSVSPPFVIDADCIIKLARDGSLRQLPPDEATIVVPFKVDEEIRRYRGRRTRAKDWLAVNRHLVKRFYTHEEGSLFVRLGRSSAGSLGEGERAGIAIARYRNGTFVSDDRVAKLAAEEIGVRTLGASEFRDRVVLRLDLR